jgi:PAS domain S-box-containing protein
VEAATAHRKIAEDVSEQTAWAQVAVSRGVLQQGGGLGEVRARVGEARGHIRSALEGADGVPREEQAGTRAVLQEADRLLAAIPALAAGRLSRPGSRLPTIPMDRAFRRVATTIDDYSARVDAQVASQRRRSNWLVRIAVALMAVAIVGSFLQHRAGTRRILSEKRRLEDMVRERTAHLEASRARTRAVIETALDAVVTADRDGSVTDWNPQAEEVFGWSREEAVGRSLAELVIPEGDRPRFAAGLAHYLATGESRVLGHRTELVALRRDGQLVPVEVAISPSGAGDDLVFNAFVRDISERIAAQNAIEQARDEAQAASRAKSAFLATMSHEIRTPMNAVIGMTGLLLDSDLTPEQREYAETVRSSGDGLLGLINDILDYSKIEAGKLDLERIPFDLRDCLESALDIVTPQAAAREIELNYVLEPGSPTAVEGDPTRLRQVLVNLLGNAVKFTHDGEVSLVADVQRAAADGRLRLALEVRDTGVGIPADRVRTLFEAFSQADSSTTRRFGGTGLGLAIVKRIVEAMGGTVAATSTPGKGSVFRIELEADAAEGVDRAMHGAPEVLQGKRLLVVDDNRTNLRIVESQSAAWGMQATATARGEEAIAWVAEGRAFDVVLLDMQMPGLDGPAVARAMREHRTAEELPLVLASSLGHVPTGGDRGLFAASLTKPLKPAALRMALADALGAADEAARRGPRVRPERGESSLRLLVAEDNVVNQRIAVLLLKRLGYRADVVADGREAVEAVLERPYDLVLMDVEMPELDGIEATRRIRAELPQARQPRIVGVTAGAFVEDRERCLAAGMDDYLSKPIQADEFALMLERAEEAAADAGARFTKAPPGTAAPPVAEDGGPAVDVSALEELTGGIPEVAAELAGAFVAESAQLTERMRSGLRSTDGSQVRGAAHSLKSSSATLGARRLSELCAELEAATREALPPDAARRVADVEEELARARSTFEVIAANGS